MIIILEKGPVAMGKPEGTKALEDGMTGKSREGQMAFWIESSNPPVEKVLAEIREGLDSEARQVFDGLLPRRSTTFALGYRSWISFPAAFELLSQIGSSILANFESPLERIAKLATTTLFKVSTSSLSSRISFSVFIGILLSILGCCIYRQKG